MKPWDPILFAAPGGMVPVADPIRVDLGGDDLEALWWAHLLASLWGLRTVYMRLGDAGQVYRTGRIHTKALDAVQKIYLGRATGIWQASARAASSRVMTWDWRQDPLALESGWWSQSAFCAHALASGYAFGASDADARALLAGDILFLIRRRVECSLPDAIADDLMRLATSTQWNGADFARAALALDGMTRAGSPITETKMEVQG